VAPEFLSFDELTELSRTADPKGPAGQKLNRLLTTPFVENGSKEMPHRPTEDGVGPIVRTAFWNIERGLNFDLIQTALGDAAKFQRDSGYENRPDNQRAAIESQLGRIRDADILILNEVDLGMKRTDYRDVGRELAAALRMNYAYGVEFVEVDPIFDLDIEQIELPDKAAQQRLEDDLAVDRGRYRGLHGNAVLSRYPIRGARILRLPVCYDWYAKEVQGIAKLEQGKRWSAEKLFRERIVREVRHGGRIALIIDLAIPGLTTGEVTIVSAHLENKCPPACRQKQMTALLDAIRDVKNPVILAGDLNTSGSDATPTSVRNEIMKRVKDYRFWITQAVFWFSPVSIPQWAIFPVKYAHGYRDPTARHVPFVWENREAGLFQKVEKFRFSDGYAFDFRGTFERTLHGNERTLANSNQRGSKGFVPTYTFERDFGGLVGNLKLDWFFVKSFIRDPRRDDQSYRFAPHFPVTMRELNEAAEDRISDHPPMTVDLPLDTTSSLQQ